MGAHLTAVFFIFFNRTVIDIVDTLRRLLHRYICAIDECLAAVK